MKLISQHTVISILVNDQDEALSFYTEKLGLEVRDDITFAPGLRLLTVAPRTQVKPVIALAKPEISVHGESHVKDVMARIGLRSPILFATDNCCSEYELLRARGVNFASAPTKQLYGVEAVFKDPYGNAFSLLEASPEIRALFKRQDVGTAA